MGPEILALSFSHEGYLGFKCSLPKDYNDPYELFLSIDTTIEPHLLAFYQESIREIPQYPTTCFSKSPIVVPMWAHYAHSSRGFVVEIDEEKLEELFDKLSIIDITYTDSANEKISDSLRYAMTTHKPRHTFFLHKAILASAYFSKQTCWNYEQERRVVVPQDYINDVDGNMIFSIPTECVSAIITGAKIESSYVEKAREIADMVGCELYQSFIGKSYPRMYMKDESGVVSVFDEERIIEAPLICDSCDEPIISRSELQDENKCSWCSITKSHRESAAESNPYRMLDDLGLLEDHIQEMEDIYRGKS